MNLFSVEHSTRTQRERQRRQTALRAQLATIALAPAMLRPQRVARATTLTQVLPPAQPVKQATTVTPTQQGTVLQSL